MEVTFVYPDIRLDVLRKPRKTSFRIAGLLASIGTQDLSNMCIYFHG
jgi:hypothetical protein